MLKEKLGLCPYEVICNEQEFILSEIQDDIEELKNENKEPKEIKSSEEPMKLNSPKKDENAIDRFDKNKFEKILAIVNSDKFNYKNKIGKIRYNDIKNLVDSINKNTVSKILAKENINTLNKLKKAEIKDKRLISGQKELLSFFDDLLDTILTENNNNNNNNNDDDDNDDDDNNEDDDDNEEENEEKGEDGDEVKDEKYYIIKQINDYYKTIDESKSFEEQINLFKKISFLYEYWGVRYYDDDNKKLNVKIFKLKIAYISKEMDEMLFENVFGCRFLELTNKLINTTNKKENQIIIKNFKKDKDKLYKIDDFYNFVIQPNNKLIDLLDAAKIILEFNETIQLELTLAIKK